MTITDEMMERAAAAALNEYLKDPTAWPRAMDYLKNAWRHIALAGLKTAVREFESDRAALIAEHESTERVLIQQADAAKTERDELEATLNSDWPQMAEKVKRIRELEAERDAMMKCVIEAKAERDAIRAKTIEECAQIAEQQGDFLGIHSERIAKAIRALAQTGEK